MLRATDAPDPSAYAGIAGAVGIDDELPLAPTRDFARPMLGTVGAATAELVKDSDGRLVAGRHHRAVRAAEALRRAAARAVRRRGARGDGAGAGRGRRRPNVSCSGPSRSTARPLATTLDERLQRLAETTLADVRPASAIVAVRPSDGHVLAAASGPGRAGCSTATWAGSRRARRSRSSPRSRCCGPGCRPASTVSCPPTITVDGRRFKNYDDYPSNRLGRVTLRTAVANSCNTAMIGQRGEGAAGRPGGSGGRPRAGRRPRPRLPGRSSARCRPTPGRRPSTRRR